MAWLLCQFVPHVCQRATTVRPWLYRVPRGMMSRVLVVITCITVVCTFVVFHIRWMGMPITCNYTECPTVHDVLLVGTDCASCAHHVHATVSYEWTGHREILAAYTTHDDVDCHQRCRLSAGWPADHVYCTQPVPCYRACPHAHTCLYTYGASLLVTVYATTHPVNSVLWVAAMAGCNVALILTSACT
jgi:hypothetical protein